MTLAHICRKIKTWAAFNLGVSTFRRIACQPFWLHSSFFFVSFRQANTLDYAEVKLKGIPGARWLRSACSRAADEGSLPHQTNTARKGIAINNIDCLICKYLIVNTCKWWTVIHSFCNGFLLFILWMNDIQNHISHIKVCFFKSTIAHYFRIVLKGLFFLLQFFTIFIWFFPRWKIFFFFSFQYFFILH